MIQHKEQLSLLGSYFYVINIYYDRTQFTCLLSIIVFHMVQITYLLNASEKTGMKSIKIVNYSLCYGFSRLIVFG